MRTTSVALTALLAATLIGPGCVLPKPAKPEVEQEPDTPPVPPDERTPPDRTPPDRTPPDERTPPDRTSPDDRTPPATAPGTDTVVVTDDGVFVASLATTSIGRCLAAAAIETGDVGFREDLCNLRALAPAGGADVLALAASGRTLWRVTLPDGAPSVVYDSDNAYESIVVAQDRGYAVITRLPETPAAVAAWEQSTYEMSLRRFVMVDLETLDADDFATPYAIRDVDVTADQVVVTMSFWDEFGFPQALLQAFDRASLGFAWEVEFPNCADDLQLQPEGPLAILAPESCSLHDVIIAEPEVVEEWEEVPTPPPGDGDPISVVDLSSGEHLANVPGFGPVAWAPDGKTAAGFTRRESLMVEWNAFQHDDFGLVVVNVDDFTWKVTDVGDERPRYAYRPDGGAILVSGAIDGARFTASLEPVGGGLTDLAGAAAALDQRALAPEGDRLFVSDAGALYEVDLAAATVAALDLGVSGDVLNLRPQGDLLVWSSGAGAHHLVSVDVPSLQSTLSLGGPIW